MFRKIKKHLPSSLFGRTLLILVLPMIFAQIITIYIFYERHWGNVSRNLAESLSGEVSLVVNYVNNVDDEQRLEKFLSSAGVLFSMKAKMLDGDEISTQISPIKHELYEDYLKLKISNQFNIYENSAGNEVLTIVNLDNGRKVLISVSKKRLANSTTSVFVIWMIATTFILMAIAIMFLKNQVRPIIRLARMADNFGRGQEISEKYKPEGAAEVKLVANAFLNMRNRISRHIRQRTEMLAGISHDLRTPLTRLKLELELLKEKLSEDEIKELSADVEDMEKMVQSYIDFVRADEEEETSRCDIAALLRGIISKYKDKLEIELISDVETQLEVREHAMQRAFVNLIENTAKFADKLKITINADKQNMHIWFEDNGTGIPENEREAVFRAFHRVESSRNRNTGGSGLGLSIVQDIINGHGGTVRMDESESLGGLKVEVKLPL